MLVDRLAKGSVVSIRMRHGSYNLSSLHKQTTRLEVALHASGFKSLFQVESRTESR